MFFFFHPENTVNITSQYLPSQSLTGGNSSLSLGLFTTSLLCDFSNSNAPDSIIKAPKRVKHRVDDKLQACWNETVTHS